MGILYLISLVPGPFGREGVGTPDGVVTTRIGTVGKWDVRILLGCFLVLEIIVTGLLAKQDTIHNGSMIFKYFQHTEQSTIELNHE